MIHFLHANFKYLFDVCRLIPPEPEKLGVFMNQRGFVEVAKFVCKLQTIVETSMEAATSKQSINPVT